MYFTDSKYGERGREGGSERRERGNETEVTAFYNLVSEAITFAITFALFCPLKVSEPVQPTLMMRRLLYKDMTPSRWGSIQ